MSMVEAEIASQPDCWRSAARLAPVVAPALPRPGEHVVVIGCGTSLYMARAFASLRESSGQGVTDAFAASELPRGRRYDRILALTRSGTTTEVVDALRLLGEAGAPRTVLTADPGAPVCGAADHVVPLDFADEAAVVQTRFATSALFLLRTHLERANAGSAGRSATLGTVITDAERALRDLLPAGALEAQQFTFLGRGWRAGLAEEAALKLREAGQAWSEAYPAMEYRHGPISVAGSKSLVWLLDTESAQLRGDIERTGATVVLPRFDALAELVQAQRLAVALAVRRGLDPDRPRHLTRSMVLDPDSGYRLSR